ncbi:MAG TPA: hypothetical protein PLW97_10110, partial [Synergistaceae bacterium]|nr:hypothetical protein [Synergistaceae bacterium]
VIHCSRSERSNEYSWNKYSTSREALRVALKKKVNYEKFSLFPFSAGCVIVPLKVLVLFEVIDSYSKKNICRDALSPSCKDVGALRSQRAFRVKGRRFL